METHAIASPFFIVRLAQTASCLGPKRIHDQRDQISAASQTIATARIAPKICQGQTAISQQCAHSATAPDLIQIGSLSVEL